MTERICRIVALMYVFAGFPIAALCGPLGGPKWLTMAILLGWFVVPISAVLAATLFPARRPWRVIDAEGRR